MNAKNAVFGLVSIKPLTIKEIRSRLPYSSKTIYSAGEELVNEGVLTKVAKGDSSVLTVADGYNAQKRREIVIQCLSHGIDYEVLLRESTLAVWKAIDGPRTVPEVQLRSALSGKWVRNALHFLERNGLVRFLRRRPIEAERVEGHPVNRLLSSYLAPTQSDAAIHYRGDIPFEEYLRTPDQIERMLYDRIERNVLVRRTGFSATGGKGRLAILESVDDELTPEELFLKKLFTTEGVEDLCIQMVSQHVMDYDALLELAISDDAVNVVGCYLDVLHSVDETIISKETIEEFHDHLRPTRRTFLLQEKEFGKGGWESRFEERWNIDLYMDLGAIRHGVSGR